jgi:hypothetical protein
MTIVDDFEIDFSVAEEAGTFILAQRGIHVCLLEVDPLGQIGNSGSQAFRVRARVIAGPAEGAVIEDLLFIGDRALPRLIRALHRVGGLQKNSDGKWPSLKPSEVRNMLDGQLARITVDRVSYRRRGDRTEYGEAEAETMRAAGEKMYGGSVVAYAGYDAPTSEDFDAYIDKHGAPSNNGASGDSDIPF